MYPPACVARSFHKVARPEHYTPGRQFSREAACGKIGRGSKFLSACCRFVEVSVLVSTYGRGRVMYSLTTPVPSTATDQAIHEVKRNDPLHHDAKRQKL